MKKFENYEFINCKFEGSPTMQYGIRIYQRKWFIRQIQLVKQWLENRGK